MSNDIVTIDRGDLRPCDKCGGPLVGGLIQIAEVKSFRLTESSVRAVASMEVYFGPGNERLAAAMSPGIEASVGHCVKHVLCINCAADVLVACAKMEES